MAGLFGYLAAGAAEGVGKGIAEEGKAKRESALKMLESDSLLDREKDLIDYRTGKETNLTTDTDGNTLNIQGGVASRLKGPDGKPVNIASSTKDTGTSETKFMEYLIKNGVAKDHNEALEIVQTGKAKGISPIDIEKATNDAIKTRFPEAFGAPTPEQEQAVRAEVMTRLGVSPKSDAPAGGAAVPVSTKAEAMALPVGKQFQYNGGTYEVVSPGKFRKVN